MRGFVAAFFCLCALTTVAAGRLPLDERTIFQGNHPRTIFFRVVEHPRNNYEVWENKFRGQMGFIGQALPDQLSDHVNGISPALAGRYARFKKQHPKQVVLLHLNGLSQVPTTRMMDDFPGHWLYFEGARVLEDVPADRGQSTFRVSDTSLFTMEAGFGKNRPDHLGLCALHESGKPDWSRAEYARLVGIDKKAGTITVKRAQFRSEPMALQADRGYAAALVTHGPWNRERGELEWHYNYSTMCPRDGKGRNAADMYVDYLASALGPSGKLHNIDGVAFDVMYIVPQVLRGQWRFRMPDYDADGDGERWFKDSTYLAGLNQFYRKLREALGEDRIITSDVQELDNQRAFGILNGGESENWLTHTDPQTEHWSSGMNRNLFWKKHAHRPTFNYLNHKFSPPDTTSPRAKKKAFQPIPYNQHRLKIASAVLCGMVVTNNRIWDELVCGKDRKIGWLGKTAGPMVRLARSARPALDGELTTPSGLLKHLHGEGVSFRKEGNEVRVETSAQENLRFEIRDIPLDGPDLTLFATMRAADRKNFPPEHARVLFASTGPKDVPHPGLMRHHIKNENRDFTFLNESEFTAVFHFRNLEGRSLDVEFCLESNEPMWLEDVRAYSAPDAIYREFENGLVLANPGTTPFTFDLAELLPGRSYRRISGTAGQDPETNNGKPVGDRVTLPPLDALFLKRRH